MKVSVIWLSRTEARLFRFSREKMERKVFSEAPAPGGTPGDAPRKLFYDAALELADADHVLLLGPCIAMHHFQAFLMEQFPAIARKIAGMEAVDQPTDAQIAAVTKKFFDRAS